MTFANAPWLARAKGEVRTRASSLGQFFWPEAGDREATAGSDHDAVLGPEARRLLGAAEDLLGIAESLRAEGRAGARYLYFGACSAFVRAFVLGNGVLDAETATAEELARAFRGQFANGLLPEDLLEVEALLLEAESGFSGQVDDAVVDDGRRAALRASALHEPARIPVKWLRFMRIGVAAVTASVMAVALHSLLPRTNLALERPATASSAVYNTHAGGAVDGIVYAQTGFHSNAESEPWLAVDLGASRPIGEVRVYGRFDCCFEQSIPLALEVSDDGVAYRMVGKRQQEFSVATPWISEFHSLNARFIRLRTLRHSVLVLSEVQVFEN